MKQSEMDTVSVVAQLWIRFLKQQYDDRLWSAIIMILKESSLPDMEEKKAYKAGLAFFALLDLKSAIGHGSIKNTAVLPVYLKAIADETELNLNKLAQLFADNPSGKSPHTMYVNIYQLFDGRYRPTQDNKVAEQGFYIAAENFQSSNYVGQFMNHES